MTYTFLAIPKSENFPNGTIFASGPGLLYTDARDAVICDFLDLSAEERREIKALLIRARSGPTLQSTDIIVPVHIKMTFPDIRSEADQIYCASEGIALAESTDSVTALKVAEEASKLYLLAAQEFYNARLQPPAKHNLGKRPPRQVGARQYA